ncbi:MAG: DUF1801 domain-containing protein [Balneolaceae bacterium]|nr:DUF1801 domain-containing protein [Balneolaceae bacterium]
MKIEASSPEEYLSKVPKERLEPMKKLRSVILKHLPKGFSEMMIYNMIGYVVPHSIYPDGYHCNPDLPLHFLNMASQKNYIALYHSGIYADEKLKKWFISAYKNRMGRKPDMGKSCIRFKKPEAIPFDLIGELLGKMSVDEWIALYEKNIKR